MLINSSDSTAKGATERERGAHNKYDSCLPYKEVTNSQLGLSHTSAKKIQLYRTNL